MSKLFILVFFVSGVYGFAQTNVTHYIMQDTVQRSFIVNVPPGYDGTSPVSCVFNFHGSGMNAAQQQIYSKMNVVSNANNFIAVYPNGIDNSWLVGFTGAYHENDRDVKFIESVLDTLKMLYNIDQDRVYACGISQGGYMSHRLACDLQDRFAAIASVAGGIADSAVFYCDNFRSVPTLLIHGTDDLFVPYAWAESTAEFWVNHNSCTIDMDTINIPDINTNDNSTVRHIVYGSCDNDVTVEIFKVEGGGHTWPDGFMSLPGYGNTNYDIKASQEIWNFFNRYTLKGTTLDLDEKEVVSFVNIFPNPAKDKIGIEGISEVFNVRIIDMNGSRFFPTNDGGHIDISGLSGGFYYLYIETQTGVIIRKFIKE